MEPFASLIDTPSGFIGVSNTVGGVAEIFNGARPAWRDLRQWSHTFDSAGNLVALTDQQ